MSLTVNTKTYSNDVARSPDSYRYINGVAHTFQSPDLIDVWRKAPIVTSDSAGKARSLAKITRGVTDGTDYVGDGIVKIEISVPADAQAADVEAIITDLGTWLLTAEADNVLVGHQLNQ